jgi:TetR/AcrR family transcriptional regulator, cholesterol catabolism regulator
MREKILEGAGKLFTEMGIRQVTMDHIAQSLGISKRTIYENFKDKEDLLENFLSNAILIHKKQAFEIMQNSENVIYALFNFGEYNHQTFKKINPCFFGDIKKYHPKVYEKLMKSGEIKNHEITFMILKRGINENIFIKDLNIELASLFIHHCMEFFHMMEERNFEHKIIWQTVFLPYLRGICTDKGRELVSTLMNKFENSDIN